MKVIIKEPGKPAEVKDIPNTLEALQETVGGYIETVQIASNLVAIFDEEGRLKKKPLNILGLVGTVVFAGAKFEQFTDISDNAIELLERSFGH